MREYYSHYREEDHTYQLNRDHQRNVAKLCEEYCEISLLKRMAYMAGLHHDDGKNNEEWQSYFEKSVQSGKRFEKEKTDHSTLGGLILKSYAPGSRLSEMAEMAVFTHHGLADCVSAADGESLTEKRSRKYTEEQVRAVRDVCEEDLGVSREEMSAMYGHARKDLTLLINELKKLTADEQERQVYGSPHFYVGMCERMLFSVLADADVRDTVDFSENCRTVGKMTDEELNAVWKTALDNLETKLEKMKNVDSPLNPVRQEISDKCERAAYSDCSRYRLAVPTGSGKTMSALRFALRRAYETGKRHIFYVSPFKSILEQNAAEIRDALGKKEWVLEHHGDVVMEREQDFWRYERLTENWDEVPVIATTAVQFFQTLFGEKKRNLRRFHSLCRSVIIFDEVQSLPVKAAGLFNLAVNFLTEAAGSTAVLCTATQPPFEKLLENRMRNVENMTDPLCVYEPRFRRTEYYDCTDGGKKRIGIEEAAEFIRRRAAEENQVLVVLNTKGAAAQIYAALKGSTEGKVFHLSTSMCPEHRRDVLQAVRDALDKEEKMICISTQLIEAGIDLSCPCVIRSLAGLDNLIQAAGRCNRNGKLPVGKVCIIQMNEAAENLSSLPEIRRSQEAMRKILRVFQQTPEQLGGRLDSEKAVYAYYKEYFAGREAEERYPVQIDGIRTDLISLLSENRLFGGRKKLFLKQAFRTAGEQFSLIDGKNGTDAVAPYKDAEAILESLWEIKDQSEAKRLMRSLQGYTVNVTDSLLKKMGPDALYQREDGILILNKRYYDEAVGVTADAGEMEFLDF